MKFKKKLGVALSICAAVTLLAGCGSTEKKADDSKNVKIETASTEDVEKALNDKDGKSIVLDARINDAYNGWAVEGAKRGGHLPGSSDFSAQWLTSEYDEKENLEGRSREKVLDITMEQKGLTPDKNVIVYDINGKDADEVAQYLVKKGIKNTKKYDAKEWINDSDKKLDSYKNYELLVAPSVVNEIVKGKTPEGFTDAKKIKIVDVRWGDNKESGYMDGHVPTSVHINTDSFEPPKENKEGDTEWKLADDKTLEKLLLDSGITSEDCVIATSPEPMAASRFAVICDYLGVKDVRVMNGGLVEWNYLGYDLEKGENKPTPEKEFGVKVPARPELIDSLDKIKDIMTNKDQHKDFTLVDNRTWGEYVGDVTGYSYHKRKGRIPGAVFGHAGVKNSSSMSYYRNIDKTMRNENEILSMWEEDNIDTSNHLSFMCGSGWRAAEILWYSKVMGMNNTSLFSDGWIGWSNAHYPIETGTPKK
nr:rhodanese-like domain-containing protein [uncultured Peptostreptococcus sp.]